MYVWDIELAIRAEMGHSLWVGTDGQLQFAPHSLRGLTWLADAHELRPLARGREYVEITVVSDEVRLWGVWASSWHDVLVIQIGDFGPVCFGPRDADGWRWTLAEDLRIRRGEAGWEVLRLDDEQPRTYGSWAELVERVW
jgi:hypothetical protein